jgi:hypothetical protein
MQNDNLEAPCRERAREECKYYQLKYNINAKLKLHIQQVGNQECCLGARV